jgi:hypothetical protein
MGYSYRSDDGAEMCFNAAKSWQLGWYEDKAVPLNEASDNIMSYQGVLGGIADYADSDHKVLVKLNTGSSTDYYVNFNRQSGINVGTQEGRNQVTVVAQGGEGGGYAESELLAKLSAGDAWSLSNFDGVSGTTATVTVNSIDGATADVSICIGPCPSPTPVPTPVPTTPDPTPGPTSSPPSSPSTPNPTPGPPPSSPTIISVTVLGVSGGV